MLPEAGARQVPCHPCRHYHGAMSDADINEDEFRDLLHARRDELQHMQAVRTEAGKTVELDQQRTGRLSRMDALQGQAMAKAGQERVEQELQRIEQALARMTRGDYGLCLDCDEPIAVGRLRADPSVTRCIQCASKRD